MTRFTNSTHTIPLNMVKANNTLASNNHFKITIMKVLFCLFFLLSATFIYAQKQTISASARYALHRMAASEQRPGRSFSLPRVRRDIISLSRFVHVY